MVPTHRYKEDFDFHESEYVVEDGRIIAYRIINNGKGWRSEAWRRPDPENKYERFPKIEDLEIIE